MSIELVTGYAGSVHVTSAQDGRRNASTFGFGRYVMPTQSQFAITVNSANSVTVSTGDAMMDGRHITSESPTTLTIDSGTQLMNRIDTVAILYTMDAGGVETAELHVYKGDESSETPVAPTLPSGNILDGDNAAAMPLWNIPITGITVGDPVKVFDDAPLSDDGTLTIDEIVANAATVGGFPVLTTEDSTQKTLWTGVYHMGAGQSANLSENVSDQTNGIVLVWSTYTDGTANNWGFNFTFIPKKFTSMYGGTGIQCHLGGFHTPPAVKYVYINNGRIAGHENNNQNRTSYGVTWNNAYYVLRNVIGV